MSDKEAEKKTQEEEEVKKKLKEAQEQLWILQLVHNPKLGQTVIVPLQKVTKQWQLDLMLNQVVKQQEMASISRVMIELLKNMGVIKESKKGLFKR